MSKQYVWSFNEERYGSDEYDSRDEAVTAAFDEEPDESVVYVGTVRKLKLSDGLNFSWIWDSIAENLYEVCGEVAELPEPPSEMQELFKVMLDEWATKCNQHPKFYQVENIEEVRREEVAP